MSNFELDVSNFVSKLTVTETKTLANALTSTQDVMDDVKRISSEIAPIDSSRLRKSVETSVKLEPRGIIGEIKFSAVEESKKGKFNYALWLHEQEYNLGDKSQAAPGTDGYEVGNKYLERPLKGESEKYVKMWAETIGKGFD